MSRVGSPILIAIAIEMIITVDSLGVSRHREIHVVKGDQDHRNLLYAMLM